MYLLNLTPMIEPVIRFGKSIVKKELADRVTISKFAHNRFTLRVSSASHIDVMGHLNFLETRLAALTRVVQVKLR